MVSLELVTNRKEGRYTLSHPLVFFMVALSTRLMDRAGGGGGGTEGSLAVLIVFMTDAGETVLDAAKVSVGGFSGSRRECWLFGLRATILVGACLYCV